MCVVLSSSHLIGHLKKNFLRNKNVFLKKIIDRLDENSIESTTSTIKADLESPISIRYMEQSSTLSLHQAATSVQTSTKNTTIKNSNNACEDDYVCHDGPILAGTNKSIFFILFFFTNKQTKNSNKFCCLNV